jgi:hypothetical protein
MHQKVATAHCQACAIGQSLMQHGLHNIYCSAQHDQCSLIIHTFWLHGVVGADLHPDTHKVTSRLLSKVSCLIGATLSFSCRIMRVYTHCAQPGHGSVRSTLYQLNGHLIHRTLIQLSTSGGTSRGACTNSTHNTTTTV